MGLTVAQSSPKTELSPLADEMRESTAVITRRLSSGEKVVQGAVRTFSVDEGYDRIPTSDDGPQISLTSPRGHPYRGRYRFPVMIVLGVFFMSFAFIFLIHKEETANSEFDIKSCSDSDAIKSLKPSSTLEGMKNGAVAADHPVCSELGISILQKHDGNAVDAAVATALCLGVANPASSGLGGGAFILIHSDRANFEAKRSDSFPVFHDATTAAAKLAGADGKITEVIDCRETAPSGASIDMFTDKGKYASVNGGLAIAIPGELRGLELAHARHGKLPWATVVEPVIRLARDGVPISKHLANDIKNTAEKKTALFGEMRKLRHYLTMDDNWGHYLKEGDLLKNPKLADTLQSIAENGSKAFYEGELAQSLIEEVTTAGGILSMGDLKNYVPTLRDPLSADVNGFTLVGVGPPSSGGAAIIGAARFLSGYKTPLASAADTLSVHRMVEALRHAFAIRMSLSDPAFNTNVTSSAVHDLVSGSYMESLRKLSRDDVTLPLSMYGGQTWAQLKDHEGSAEALDRKEGDRRRLRRGIEWSRQARKLVRTFGYLEDSGTSHLSVMDKDGNAVAITTSINTIFGSCVFSETTGVLLGNTMDGEFASRYLFF